MELTKKEQDALAMLNKEERMNMESFSVPSYVQYYNKGRFRERERELADAWLSGGSKKILDITCGTGRTTIALKEMGHDVEGIDIAPAMIEVARKQYPDIRFHVMNACKLEYPDGSFDVSYVAWNGFDCIYPEDKRVAAFREAIRVLRPGGLLIFSSHNSHIWPTNKYHFFWWFLNIVTGRIFTAYRYEFKGMRAGIKLMLFHRKISYQIQEIKDLGMKYIDIFPEFSLLWAKKKYAHTNDIRKIDLWSTWAYFVFQKPGNN